MLTPRLLPLMVDARWCSTLRRQHVLEQARLEPVPENQSAWGVRPVALVELVVLLTAAELVELVRLVVLCLRLELLVAFVADGLVTKAVLVDLAALSRSIPFGPREWAAPEPQHGVGL